jgi:hypothetical protein
MDKIIMEAPMRDATLAAVEETERLITEAVQALEKATKLKVSSIIRREGGECYVTVYLDNRYAV